MPLNVEFFNKRIFFRTRLFPLHFTFFHIDHLSNSPLPPYQLVLCAKVCLPRLAKMLVPLVLPSFLAEVRQTGAKDVRFCRLARKRLSETAGLRKPRSSFKCGTTLVLYLHITKANRGCWRVARRGPCVAT